MFDFCLSFNLTVGYIRLLKRFLHPFLNLGCSKRRHGNSMMNSMRLVILHITKAESNNQGYEKWLEFFRNSTGENSLTGPRDALINSKITFFRLGYKLVLL